MRDLAVRRIDFGCFVRPPEDIGFVVDCHLHFDHCGGNPALAGRPVFTQRAELEAALHTPDYTLTELVDAPGLPYERLDSEAEILPDVVVMPTPGHTAGHQSLIVRQPDGTVIVAGRRGNRVRSRRAGLAGAP